MVLEKDRIMLHSPAAALRTARTKAGREARILGVVDAEIRPITSHQDCPNSTPIGRSSKAATSVRTKPSNQSQGFSQGFSFARGLSFREASGMSRWIAGTLQTSTISRRQAPFPTTRHCRPATAHPKDHHAVRLVLHRLREFLRASGTPVRL